MNTLQQLLDRIRAGGTLETRVLAGQLDTSPEMITAMLEHLERLGHIRDYVDCGDGCRGCSLTPACHLPAAARLWQSPSKD